MHTDYYETSKRSHTTLVYLMYTYLTCMPHNPTANNHEPHPESLVPHVKHKAEYKTRSSLRFASTDKTQERERERES